MMINLSIVIPAYNEESGIQDIVERVLSTSNDLAAVDVRLLELIVVDDCSRDLTAQITSDMAEKCEQLRLVRHSKNKGYGGALKTGFSQARGDLIGFLDADGTYPPEYFPQLCQAAMNGKDLVVGSRMAGATSEMPVTRRVGNLFFAGLLSLLGRQHITDSASGMRVFKRSVLERIYPLPDGLNLTPVMSTRAIHEGIPMAEVPIPYSERVGRSKLSVVRDGSIFLQSMVWTVMSYNPVRIFGIIGLIGLGLAAFLIGGLVVTRLSGVTTIGPWGVAALYAALVFAQAGISIFALGVTFNYLVSMFYKRPIRQGLFGKPIFSRSIDHHFGWAGLVAAFVGLLLAGASLVLGISGWEIARLWLYLLGSSMLILTGMQLVVYWILLRVLDELSQRDNLVERDMVAG
jgi:glycosyltransferase involved in cell wall biosynthesis